jgi:beta-lactam-binding protein with PASTA domain
MPDIVGLSVTQAQAALFDAGLDDFEVQKRPYAEPAEIVLEQTPSSGAYDGQEIVLIISESTTVPELVGVPTSSARQTLKDLGVQVVVEQEVLDGVAPDTVAQTDPVSGATLSSTVTLKVAEPESGVFASVLKPIQSQASSEPAVLDGTPYPNSLVVKLSRPATVEYALNRRIRNFTATVGTVDKSSDAVPSQFVVYADDVIVYNEIVPFGETREINVSVLGVLRIRLEASPVGSQSSRLLTAAWGNARFSGGQSAVDALVSGDS